MVEFIVEGLENRSAALSVFLDLSNAFGCVDHEILLSRLEYYGVREVPHKWIRSYLVDHSYQVQVGGDLSQPTKLKHGVPQGSIFGPILFIIYVNNVSSAVNMGLVVQYAAMTRLSVSEQNQRQSWRLQLLKN